MEGVAVLSLFLCGFLRIIMPRPTAFSGSVVSSTVKYSKVRSRALFGALARVCISKSYALSLTDMVSFRSSLACVLYKPVPVALETSVVLHYVVCAARVTQLERCVWCSACTTLLLRFDLVGRLSNVEGRGHVALPSRSYPHHPVVRDRRHRIVDMVGCLHKDQSDDIVA